MATDPSTRSGLPLKHVRDLVSKSTTFQDWTGSPDAATALDRILYHTLDQDTPLIRPWCIVEMPVEDAYVRQQEAVGVFGGEGSVLVTFQDDVLVTDIASEQMTKFMNKALQVADDVERQAVIDGFRLLDFVPEVRPMLGNDDEKASRGSYAFAVFRLRYDD